MSSEFLLYTSSFSSASADSSPSVFQIVLFLWICPLFFRSFCILQISIFLLRICVFQIVFSVLLLPLDLVLQFFKSSSSSSSNTSIELESEKLKFHVDKLLHLSTGTWVFDAQIYRQNRASQTRDASFLNDFKTLLTNDILSQNYASLQITSDNWYMSPFCLAS